MLYICATPIGNLDDITLRVLETLKNVDFIAAEDTRHTKRLLNHFDIKTDLISYHEHNKNSRGPEIIGFLKEGKNIALVSDAGMPAISDPGQELVELCIEHDLEMTVLPGACAFVCGLVISGIDTRRFYFEGFLPAQKKERQKKLKELSERTVTTVIYEAPHDIAKTLSELKDYVSDRKIAAVREITKKFEEVKRGNIEDLIEHFKQNVPRGEFVIVIEGAKQQKIQIELNDDNVKKFVEKYVQKGFETKEAIKETAKEMGYNKRDIYKIWVDINKKSG